MSNRHWIAQAISSPGALHRQLGVPQDKTIPQSKINQAANSNDPTLAKRAQLAKTLAGLHK